MQGTFKGSFCPCKAHLKALILSVQGSFKDSFSPGKEPFKGSFRQSKESFKGSFFSLKAQLKTHFLLVYSSHIYIRANSYLSFVFFISICICILPHFVRARNHLKAHLKAHFLF